MLEQPGYEILRRDELQAHRRVGWELTPLFLRHLWRMCRIRLLLLHGELPCCTALFDGRFAGLYRFHMGDLLERRVQFTLHGKDPYRVVAEHDVVDCLHAIAPRGHHEGRGEVVAVLIGGSMVLGIQPMHGIACLLIERVIRVRRVIQPHRSRCWRRLVIEPRTGMAQRIECL